MASPHFYLLRLPCEIRRIIYESFYPVAKHIKLTSGPVSEEMTHEAFTICQLSSEAINLMLVCRQINDETTAILYGTNTFSMVPSESLTLHPSEISLRWLHDLRSSTKRVVKKLDIHAKLPMNRSGISDLISGVSIFPTLQIRVVQKYFKFEQGRVRLTTEELMKNMTEVCDGVMKMRGSAPTTWNDMGSFFTQWDFYKLKIITARELLGENGNASRWTVTKDEWTQRKNKDQRFGLRGSTSYKRSTLRQ